MKRGCLERLECIEMGIEDKHPFPKIKTPALYVVRIF